MRKLFKNANASTGYFAILAIIIFFIVMLTIFEFSLYNDSADITGNIDPLIYDTVRYQNMTVPERQAYYWGKHGANQFGGTVILPNSVPDFGSEGNYVFYKVFFTEPKLSFPDVLGRWYAVFPDGEKVEWDKYQDFINGKSDINDVDVAALLGKIATLDFTIFESLGFIGAAIRLLLGVLIAVILYLLLPLTG